MNIVEQSVLLDAHICNSLQLLKKRKAHTSGCSHVTLCHIHTILMRKVWAGRTQKAQPPMTWMEFVTLLSACGAHFAACGLKARCWLIFTKCNHWKPGGLPDSPMAVMHGDAPSPMLSEHSHIARGCLQLAKAQHVYAC